MALTIPHRLKQRLEQRSTNGTLRQLKKQQVGTDFASNDYLGLANMALAQSSHDKEFHLGSGGSRLLSGHTLLAQEVENRSSRLFSSEAALLFSSGYALNTGLLQAICAPGDLVIMDECIHASFKAGVKLSSATAYFFRHNDLAHLAKRLSRLLPLEKEQQCFVVVESLYSMDGDLVPLRRLVELCHQYGVAVICDEAHGLGTLGQNGEGLVESLGLQDQIFARIHTFGKAIGCHGAVALGSRVLIDCLLNFCHSFIYTTALSDHSLNALLVQLERFQYAQERIEKLHHNIELLNVILGRHQQSPIFSLEFSSIENLKNAALSLEKHQLIVHPIYSPTVRRGRERLRVVLHSFNTEQEIHLLGEELLRFATDWT